MRPVRFLTKLISLVLSSIVLSVGIMGVSYSYFTGANRINSNVSMGNIDVVFSNIEILPDSASDPSCITKARIADNGKSIEINIENARPGCTSIISYEVTNNGTVPVVYELKQASAEGQSPVSLNICASSCYIKRNGGQAWGQIVVTVGGNTDGLSSYGLDTELNFQQTTVEGS